MWSPSEEALKVGRGVLPGRDRLLEVVSGAPLCSSALCSQLLCGDVRRRRQRLWGELCFQRAGLALQHSCGALLQFLGRWLPWPGSLGENPSGGVEWLLL